MIVSPIIRSDDDPRRMAGRAPLGFFTRRTARSLSESDPTTSQSYSIPAFVIAVILDAPETTWSLVRMIPFGSMIAPEPSDWLRRWRGWLSKPKKKSSKTEGRRRRIASAEMLTTDGETFSTTCTISLLRVGRGGAARIGPAARAAPTTAGRRLTASTTAYSDPPFPRQKETPPRGGVEMHRGRKTASR